MAKSIHTLPRFVEETDIPPYATRLDAEHMAARGVQMLHTESGVAFVPADLLDSERVDAMRAAFGFVSPDFDESDFEALMEFVERRAMWATVRTSLS